VLVLASAKATIKPLGLVGHQNVGYMWSNKERRALNQDPANLARALLTERFPWLADPGPILQRILERFFPELLVPIQPPNTKSSTWAMFYSFDQYFWQPGGDPKRGIGLYFTFGASDGNPNPIQYFYNLGIGGNGVVPERP
jgi:porin